jgi:hypothetical protein
LPELFGTGQLPRDENRSSDLLLICIRETTNAACGHLSILCLNCRDDVVRSDVEADHLRRIDPDAHRSLRRKDLSAAYAIDTLKLTKDVSVQIVAQTYCIGLSIGRDQSNHHKEAGSSFLNLNTLLDDRAWKARLNTPYRILDIDGRLRRIDPRFEGRRDRNHPRRVGRGLEIQEALNAVEFLFDRSGYALIDRFG